MKLTDLPWEHRFVDRLPGDREARNFPRQVRHAAYSEVHPTPVVRPRLLGWSADFAASIGLDRTDPDEPAGVAAVELLGGSRVLPGMRPYAARYGGHQFGQWAGQLGDGRAITLGEASFPSTPFPGARRLEFQLKGAGQTPYSRHADGLAVLRSSVREFLCSEAMHYLGVPTTRALSVVTTGEDVIRDMFYDGNPAPEPGAVVCRVAPSFLRFGSFEILAASGEEKLLKQLADLLIADHYPQLDLADPDVYGLLLDEIARRTADMVVHWQRVGFVHGVMNTDNMSALGLTIDYGPYGWLEPYDPDWTPNTTDAGMGRYRFGHQPSVALWNLNRLAAALLSLVGTEERATRGLEVFRDTFHAGYDHMLAAKFGLSSANAEDDRELIDEAFDLLKAAETDFTLFFRGLCDWPAKAAGIDQAAADAFLARLKPALYADALGPDVEARWVAWSRRYAARAKREPASEAERSAVMRAANPKYVLRNYMAQNAITAAENGDASVIDRLLRVLRTPYDEQPGEEDLAVRRPEWARSAPGCSALSCSS